MFVIQGQTLLNPRSDRFFVLLSYTKGIGQLGKDGALLFRLLLPLVVRVDCFLNSVVEFLERAIFALEFECFAIHLQNCLLSGSAEERC